MVPLHAAEGVTSAQSARYRRDGMRLFMSCRIASRHETEGTGMVLIATVVGGLIAGAVWGFGKKSLLIYGAVWFLVFVLQTMFVADSADREKPAYWILSAVFLVLGIALVGIGTWARNQSEG